MGRKKKKNGMGKIFKMNIKYVGTRKKKRGFGGK
jgi:hypothetical protein